MKTIIYFYHIVKTGGTFLNHNLKYVSKQLNTNFYWFYEPDQQIKDKQKIEENKIKLKKFIKTIPNMKKKYIILEHHHNFGGIDDIYQDIIDIKKRLNKEDKFFLFTIVREPISHITSLVNYVKNNLRKKNFTYNKIINEKIYNIQSSYILYGNKNNGTIDTNLLKKHLQLFDKIYIIEKISDVQKDIEKILNKKLNWNNKEKNISVKTEFMTEEQKQIILDNNKEDIWLYNLVKTNYGL